ncbi:uncharacterized protein G2W53_010657 [Senna tora]|uniref:Uncharacterized protein n=1 Tax=Senna tora TaxID=362788 RepID=A0A834X1E9_9FABA|nr:uncharacterized protein G2W53_010657 [Senna tora]
MVSGTTTNVYCERRLAYRTSL